MVSVLEYARQKLARKGCDLLVVNRVDQGRAFGAPDNAAVLLAPGAAGAQVVAEVPLGPKTVLAAAVWDAVVERLAGQLTGRPAAPPR
jgi:phosphopantothenoylcysteine decarboxylase/phosphopantothenate--cysteine ligase